MSAFHKTGVKSGVQLSEYNGAWSIQTGFQDDQGKITLEWIRAEHWDKEQKKRVPNEKNTPLKIYLGNKATALNILKSLLWELEGDPQIDTEPDTPF